MQRTYTYKYAYMYIREEERQGQREIDRQIERGREIEAQRCQVKIQRILYIEYQSFIINNVGSEENGCLRVFNKRGCPRIESTKCSLLVSIRQRCYTSNKLYFYLNMCLMQADEQRMRVWSWSILKAAQYSSRVCRHTYINNTFKIIYG